MAMSKINHERKGPTENRAGSWPCGQKVFSVLIFCYLFYQEKSSSPAAMSEQNTLFKREYLC